MSKLRLAFFMEASLQKQENVIITQNITAKYVNKGDLMIFKVKSCALYGINGYLVDVEIDLSNGLPGFDKVGL